MTSRTIDEFRRRAGMDGWTYYLWAIMLAGLTAVVAWLTFRGGIAPILARPEDLLIFTISLAVLVTFWHARPRKKAPPPNRPLGL